MADERTRSQKEWDSGYWNGKSDAQARFKTQNRLQRRAKVADGTSAPGCTPLREERMKEPDVQLGDERSYIKLLDQFESYGNQQRHRAEAAETALRDVEDTLRGGWLDPYPEHCIPIALGILKRTTTTEEAPEPRTRQAVWDAVAEGERA